MTNWPRWSKTVIKFGISGIGLGRNKHPHTGTILAADQCNQLNLMQSFCFYKWELYWRSCKWLGRLQCSVTNCIVLPMVHTYDGIYDGRGEGADNLICQVRFVWISGFKNVYENKKFQQFIIIGNRIRNRSGTGTLFKSESGGLDVFYK